LRSHALQEKNVDFSTKAVLSVNSSDVGCTKAALAAKVTNFFLFHMRGKFSCVVGKIM
jgi:hypothetical protein